MTNRSIDMITEAAQAGLKSDLALANSTIENRDNIIEWQQGEIKRLMVYVELLAGYARHKDGCGALNDRGSPCDCGLGAALAKNPAPAAARTADGLVECNVNAIAPEVREAAAAKLDAMLNKSDSKTEIGKAHPDPVSALDAWRRAQEHSSDDPNFWRGFHYAREVLFAETRLASVPKSAEFGVDTEKEK